MRLDRLRVEGLPGLPEPFVLEPAPGVNILLGPNASGKSSVARAVRGLLWPELEGAEGHHLVAEFADAQGPLTAQRQGGRTVAWRRAGVDASAPGVPGGHLAGCYHLSALDLLTRGETDLGRRLAVDLRTRMTGGVDLEGLAEAIGKPSSRRARQRTDALTAARRHVAEVRRAQDGLKERWDGMADLERRLAEAADADRQARACEAVQALRAARKVNEAAGEARRSLPDAVANARPEDADNFTSLQESMAERRNRGKSLADGMARIETELAQIVPTGAADPAEVLTRLEGRLPEGRRREQASEAAAATLTGAERAWHDVRSALTRPELLDDNESLPDDNAFRALVGRHRSALERAATDKALDRLTAQLPRARVPHGAVPWIMVAFGVLLVLMPVLAPMLTPSVVWPACAVGVLLMAMALGQAVKVAADRIGRRLADQRPTPDGAEEEESPWTLGQALDEGGWLRDLDLLRQAAARRTDHRAAAAVAERAAMAAAKEREAAAELLRPWSDTSLADWADIEAAASALGRRCERRDHLQEQHTGLVDQARSNTADLDAFARERHDLLARLGLPDGTVEAAPVRDLVDLIPRRDEADEALRDARRQVTVCAAAIAGHEDLDALSNDDLDEALAAATDAAAARMDLHEELVTLRNAVEDARRGDDLGRALAAEASCRADLEAWRDEALEQALERALLAELQDRYEALEAPPQLERARDLFASFTDNRYHLVVAPSASGFGFRAHDDHTGHVLEPDQMSDGTRAQLQLAVRLAFLEHAETQERPPLFLDESLTTADRTRLDAVVAAVGRLAADDGRQVFYMASRTADAAAWQDALARHGLPTARVLDLAAARGQGTTATAAQLAAATLPDLPAPADHSVESYGLALRIRRFDPREPWQAVDSFHVAAPDLELVHRLRTLGLATCGSLDRHLASHPALTADAAAALAADLEVLRAVIDTWRVGRPRALTAQDVQDSEAVSDNMRAAVLELLARSEGDAGRFMTALRAGGVKRFRTEKAEELANDLADAGLLDDRPALDDDAILAEVQRRLAAGTKNARTPVEVRALVVRLLSAIPRTVAENPSSRPAG